MPYSDPQVQADYQKRWIAERRREYFVGKWCVDCGATVGLELDHVDPTTKVSHNIWSWSDVRRFAELVKCVVRCSPCHEKKSIQHGDKISNRKLTDVEVREIRILAGQVTQKELGRRFGVDRATISKVIRGVRWGHLI